MTHVMGIARDEAVQVLIEQALCRLFLATKATAGNKVRRSLQLAAHIDQALRHAYILLNRTIALRMSDDHLVATALQIVNRVLVLSKRIRIGMRRKLEQKLVGPIEMQVIRGIDTKLNELSMVDLEAHLERKTVSVIAQQLKGNPALLQSLMRSRDGQALMQMLSGGDRGASLQRAAQSAAKGNPAEMVRMVNQLMQSPDGAALIDRINKTMNGR